MTYVICGIFLGMTGLLVHLVNVHNQHIKK